MKLLVHPLSEVRLIPVGDCFMSTIPNLEKILLEAEKCFGFPVGSGSKKFTTLGISIEKHDKKVAKILMEILEALELDEEETQDFYGSIMSWFQFYKRIELNLWTHNAEKKQIIWFFLGYVFIPFIARTAANWNIDGAKGKGMPNVFWYLPRSEIVNGSKTLVLPIQQMMKWLEDLLGQPMDRIKESLDGQSIEPESVERTLYNWKGGILPEADKINQYFANKTKWSFKGCYEPKTNKSLEEKFRESYDFLKDEKHLDTEGVRDQLLLANRRLDSIFAGKPSDEDKELFIEATAERYAIPTMSILRKRFRLARAGQDAYQKLLEILCPDVEPTETDPSKNKLLQLINQYQRIFNLTTEAFNQCGPNQPLEDQWFDKQLYDFEKMTTLLSIAPSKQSEYTAELLGDYLSYIFRGLDKTSNLEDHYINYNDAEDFRRNALFHLERVDTLVKKLVKYSESSKELQNEIKPWKMIQKHHDPETLSQILGSDFSHKTTSLLLKRLEEVAEKPQEQLFLYMHKLANFLNKKQNKDKSIRHEVTTLLDKAEKNEHYPQWEAVFLQYEAKHYLACNEFGSSDGLAEKYFKDALEACERNNYGLLRGEIARDAFATLVSTGKLIVNNHEKYYRNLLRYMEVGGIDISIENAAEDLHKYFWENLYTPYPEVNKLKPTLFFRS